MNEAEDEEEIRLYRRRRNQRFTLACINCLKYSRDWYHRYGIKHLFLMFIFTLYILLGGIIFYNLETPAHNAKVVERERILKNNRTVFIQQSIIKELFNNSHYLLYIGTYKTDTIFKALEYRMLIYEDMVKASYEFTDYNLTFQDALIYACSVISTIGYGHLHPLTSGGKVATMIYLVIGLPLVLYTLKDISGFLVTVLNVPSRAVWQCWKCIKFFAHQSIDELDALKAEDSPKQQKRLDQLTILDIPLALAIFVNIGWLFLGAFLFSIWEFEWDVVTALYFCFNSISTIGQRYPIPIQTDLFLVMFVYIFVGIALVSTLIHLVYVKFLQAYTVTEFLPLDPNDPIGPGVVLAPYRSPRGPGTAGERETLLLSGCSGGGGPSDQLLNPTSAGGDSSETHSSISRQLVSNRGGGIGGNTAAYKRVSNPSQATCVTLGVWQVSSDAGKNVVVENEENRKRRGGNRNQKSQPKCKPVQVDYIQGAGQYHVVHTFPANADKSLDDVSRLLAIDDYSDDELEIYLAQKAHQEQAKDKKWSLVPPPSLPLSLAEKPRSLS